jgi:hypothetical protein
MNHLGTLIEREMAAKTAANELSTLQNLKFDSVTWIMHGA